MRKSIDVQAFPPDLRDEPVIHGDSAVLNYWVMFYWRKLQLPVSELSLLAITQDRREFRHWTGKRLHTMALGCYCFLPARKALKTQPSGSMRPHRHLIFIEPAMQSRSIEVTVAHELIHLADRIGGNPRRHRHHGYDAIAADEAAITGYTLEDLRQLLQEESLKREQACRERRPVRYLYECPSCHKQYPRARRYSQPVSCSRCDTQYNPAYQLQLASEAS